MIKEVKNTSGAVYTIGPVDVPVDGILKHNELAEDLYSESIFPEVYSGIIEGALEAYDYNGVLISSNEALKVLDDKIEALRSFGAYFRIYDYVSKDKKDIYEDLTIVPFSVKYSIDLSIKLARSDEFDQYGFLRTIKYYRTNTKNVDPDTLIGSDSFDYEILTVQVDYNVGSNGYVSDRRTTRKWMLTDGTYSQQEKISFKSYNQQQAQREGEKRRNNIIHILKQNTGSAIYVAELLKGNSPTSVSAEDIGKPFLAYLSESIKAFNEGAGADVLISEINTADAIAFPFLEDNTATAFDSNGAPTAFSKIRDVIINTLESSKVTTGGLNQQ